MITEHSEGLACPFCRGRMGILERPRYNRIATSAIIILGVLAVLSIQGVLIGVLLLIVGLVMAFSTREIWYCENCRGVIERIPDMDKKSGGTPQQVGERYVDPS